MRYHSRGFTLIELMITVAVVAILAAIAFPSYQEHMRKSRRAEAQAYMMSFASRQQQLLVDTRSFATTIAAVGVSMPSNVATAYTAELDPATASTFTLTLTPTAQQDGERCGTLGIDHNGAKTASVSSCW